MKNIILSVEKPSRTKHEQYKENHIEANHSKLLKAKEKEKILEIARKITPGNNKNDCQRKNRYRLI